MKQTLLFLFLFASSFLLTCKKDKAPAGAGRKTVLSKVYENDILILQFVYQQQQIVQVKEYDKTTGLLDYFSRFEYDGDGQLIKEKQFSNAGKLTGQVEYTHESNGDFQKQEYRSLTGIDSGKITSRLKFAYDGSGRISKESWFNVVTDAMEVSNELTYYSNGNLKSSTVYYYLPAKTLEWKTDYGPEGDPVPSDFNEMKCYPINFLLYDLVTGERHFYQYSGGATVALETNTVFTDREYDSKGFLSKQKFTTKRLIPVGLSGLKQARYEYVEL
ncbi:MAG: hypothetical protein ABI480_16595 [Chitinophagaceae bacterium]